MPQVFGGLDGIITTFAVVAAVAGAGLSADMGTLMGVANLVRFPSIGLGQPSDAYLQTMRCLYAPCCDAKVSDGISMGLGDYLSERSEKDYIHQGVCPRQPCPYSLGIYGTLPGLRLRMQCVLRAYHLPRASLSQ